jgi:hypothetical protein
MKPGHLPGIFRIDAGKDFKASGSIDDGDVSPGDPVSNVENAPGSQRFPASLACTMTSGYAVVAIVFRLLSHIFII